MLFAGAEARKHISPVYGRHERIWIEDVQVSDLAISRDGSLAFEARHACRLAQVLDRDYNGLRRLSLGRIESCNGNGLQGR